MPIQEHSKVTGLSGEVAKLRLGYSALCWVVGISACHIYSDYLNEKEEKILLPLPAIL